MTEAPEYYDTGVFALYVTAECWIKNNGGSVENDDTATAAANKAATEALIKSTLKNVAGYSNISAVELSAAKVSGQDYFTLTVTGRDSSVESDTYRVYYTTDIKSSMVAYIGKD